MIHNGVIEELRRVTVVCLVRVLLVNSRRTDYLWYLRICVLALKLINAARKRIEYCALRKTHRHIQIFLFACYIVKLRHNLVHTAVFTVKHLVELIITHILCNVYRPVSKTAHDRKSLFITHKLICVYKSLINFME